MDLSFLSFLAKVGEVVIFGDVKFNELRQLPLGTTGPATWPLARIKDEVIGNKISEISVNV